jgi:hypothetical protein
MDVALTRLEGVSGEMDLADCEVRLAAAGLPFLDLDFFAPAPAPALE